MSLHYLKLTITNNSVSALEDVQVKVSQPLIESEEIAVYEDKDRTTLFNWWSESAGELWLKLNLNISESKELHIYWGTEESNASRGDGDGVFDFFDDFTGSVLDSNKWNHTGGSFSIANSRLRIDTGSVYTVDTVASQPHTRLEAKARWHETTGNYSGLVMADASGLQGSNAGSNKLVLYMKQNNNSPWAAGWAAAGNTAGYDILSGENFFTINPEQDYELILRIDDSKTHWFTDGHQLAEANGGWNAPYYIILGYWTGSNAGVTDGADISYDWVRVRKHPPFDIVTTQEWTRGSYLAEIEESKQLIGYLKSNPGILEGEFSNLGRADAKLVRPSRTIKWGGAYPLIGRHGH